MLHKGRAAGCLKGAVGGAGSSVKGGDRACGSGRKESAAADREVRERGFGQ
jgi:hypothetical protein